jgi:hypothetical protein
MVEADEFVIALAWADDGVIAAFDQHFRHQGAGIIRSRLHGHVSARRHYGE